MKSKISIFFLIMILFGLIYIINSGHTINDDIENNGKESVGRFVAYDKYGKTRSYYFVFYINDKKYRENGGNPPEGFLQNKGKFYRIIYSEKYKGFFRVFFDKEVRDTAEILNAGFSRDEILNIPSSAKFFQ
jgi:hypothetical protein